MRDGSAIAVVGMSCRVPEASDPAAFWSLLRAGTGVISQAPEDRWPVGEDVAAALSPAARHGAFLEHVDLFDSSFFGISPSEATAMDPQQRLMLELCWEAFEDAMIVPDTLRDSHAGVFVGSISSDYADLLRECDPATLSRYALTGMHRSLIANRVSYAFGLRGPSMTVDTGQSSSLVAVHLACESLRRGESELALACGVHLNISAHSALVASKFGVLSPEGRCFTFDGRADGSVRGEGGGVVLLKPLVDALACGEHIYCVIRGSAVNNDGGGGGLTAPSAQAQEEVLRLAYRRAKVKRGDIQYVELHGTGTPLGDRIEAAALGAALGSARSADNPLPVGSVKTNVGHLEAAAGVLGLIKTALAIERREIPPSLNFQTANPDIPLDALRLRVQQTLGEWPTPHAPLLAGVSSFGIGGTNCHVVLGESPPTQPSVSTFGCRDVVHTTGSGPFGEAQTLVWVLSGRGEDALHAQVERLGAYLDVNSEFDAVDTGYSLAVGRTVFENRAVIIGDDRQEILAGLQTLADGSLGVNTVVGVAGRSGTVFLFPGQGSQWVGMACALLDCSPIFREQIEECEEAFAPLLDWKLADVLKHVEGAPGLERIDVLQPALFAVMVSLARLWGACGVVPDVVVGHSQGEVAAAYVAGGLTLSDAARVVALRSRIQADYEGHGGMMSIAAPQVRVRALLERWEDRIVVAAINGPHSLVLAGESDALAELVDVCDAEGIRARRIKSARGASHSRQVEPLREELLDVLSSIEPRAGHVPFCSTVTGGLLDTRELGAEYWYRNMREPVQFEPAVRGLLDAGYRTFLEISAHPVLTGAVQDTIDGAVDDIAQTAGVIGTLRRDQGDWRRFLHALAEAWVAGAHVDWSVITRHAGSRRVQLPTYAFQRRRHWLAVPAVTRNSAGPHAAAVEEPLSDLAGTVNDAGNRASVDVNRIVEQGDDGSDATVCTHSRLERRLVGASTAERKQIVLGIVRTQVAVVLGYDSADAVETSCSFKDLGFDSRGVVDLRDRLRMATGLRLAPTLVFDHPTPKLLAGHILGQLSRSERITADQLQAEFERLESMLRAFDDDALERVEVTARLQRFLVGLRDSGVLGENPFDEFASASDDEVFELIDRELGVS